MIATNETLRKLSALEERDFNMVVSLIDRLSINGDLDAFRNMRKRTSLNPMSEEDVEKEVNAARKELYAADSN